MPTRNPLSEEIIPLTFDGYSYSGRVVHQPNARLAPIVLIGGAFQYQHSWGRLERGFLPAASVITVDLPGWGGAQRLPAEHGFGFLSAAVDQLLSKVTSSTVNVVGTSYGGAVAQRWVQDHPAQAERLALIGTSRRLTAATRRSTERSIQLVRDDHRAEFVRTVLEGMMCLSPHVTIARRAAVTRCMTRALSTLSADDLTKYCDNSRRLLASMPMRDGPPPRVPVLVATGQHDPLSTPALSREIAARCPDARFTTLLGADHLVHLERPEELVDLLLRFFADEPLDDLAHCTPVERFGTRSTVSR
jgi:pimeloyl-ACP methyl ester carboxylesterase